MADSSQLGTALVVAADEALPLFTGLRAVGESGGGTWRGSGTLGTVEVALTWDTMVKIIPRIGRDRGM